MDEVGEAAWRHVGKQWITAVVPKLVPADLRHLQALAGSIHLAVGETHHSARQHTQAGICAHLLALLKEQLHADADPQHRLACRDRIQHQGLQPAASQAQGARPERTHPGNNHPACTLNDGRIARQPDVGAGATKRFLHAVKVTNSVVDDRNHAAKAS
jgi:hypothetical protein